MIAIAVLAQVAGTLELLDTSRIDARTNYTAGAAIPFRQVGTSSEVIVAADALTAPSLRLTLRERRWTASVTAGGSVTAADIELGQDPSWLLSSAAILTFTDRFVRLTLSQSESYARTDTGYLFQVVPLTEAAPTTGATGGQTGMGSTKLQVQQVPQQAQTILTGSTSTSGTLSFTPSRRVVFNVAAGYAITGGLDEEARETLPETYGPVASMFLGYGLTRRDGIGTLVTAQDTFTRTFCSPSGMPEPVAGGGTVPCTTDAPIAAAQETLRHQFSRASTLTVGAGLGGAIVTTTAARSGVASPVGSLAYVDRFGHDGLSTLNVTAQLMPMVDLVTGLPSERFGVDAGLNVAMPPTVNVLWTLGFLRSFPFACVVQLGTTCSNVTTTPPLTVLTQGVEARYHVSRLVDVSIGEQLLWQHQDGYPNVPADSFSAIGFVGLVARTKPLRF
jgi:hypothetical protein